MWYYLAVYRQGVNRLDNLESIAVRLRKAMDAAEKKQADLVRETGLDRGSISSYLSGKYEPKQKAIYKLASALNVSEAWLLGYDVPMHRSDAQKKNDQLSKLIVRMRTDSDFFETVAALADLTESQYRGVKQLLTAIKE